MAFDYIPLGPLSPLRIINQMVKLFVGWELAGRFEADVHHCEQGSRGRCRLSQKEEQGLWFGQREHLINAFSQSASKRRPD